MLTRPGPRFLTALLTLCLGLSLGLGRADAGQAEGFSAWLAALRVEARARGISAAVLDRALADIAPLPRIIELDRKQPEFSLTFDQYLNRIINPARVREGRRKLAENRAILNEVGRKFGVQPRFIVALWGIETGFGRHTGGFRVVEALATLAYDGRRSAYFRKELLNALQILEEGHIAPEKMLGSWAGAMGQSQFMPSSFLNFAVDYDGDGRRDIWTTKPDVFASAANYLARSGWLDDQTWGRRVRLPADFDLSLAGLDTSKPLGAWQALGVRREDGRDLPRRQLPASLILPDGTRRGGAGHDRVASGPAFLVYENFRTTMKWNRSTYFAVAVGLLADRIAGR